MKRVLLISSLIAQLCCIGTLGCAQNWEWTTAISSSGKEGGRNYSEVIGFDITTSNQSIYVAGLFTGNLTTADQSLQSNGWRDALLVKMDKNGHVIWVVGAGGKKEDKALGIALDQSENIYITGAFADTALFGDIQLIGDKDRSKDVFIAKYSPNGKCLWAIKAGGQDSEIGHNIVLDLQGNIYITGSYKGVSRFDDFALFSGSEIATFIAKYSPEGKCLWANNIDGYPAENGLTIDTQKEKLYVTGAHLLPPDLERDGISGAANKTYLRIYNYDGLPEREFGGTASLIHESSSVGSRPTSCTADPEGNLYVSGHFENKIVMDTNTLVTHGKKDIFLAQYSPEGLCNWATQTGNRWYEHSEDILIDKEGNVWCVGSVEGNLTFGQSSITGKFEKHKLAAFVYNKNGEEIDILSCTGGGSSRLISLTQDANGQIFATGRFGSSRIQLGAHSLGNQGTLALLVARIK